MEKKYEKIVKTLEAAILLKVQILGEIQLNKEIIKYEQKITRNADGLAVICMSNGIECIVEEDHWYDLNQYTWNSYKNIKDNEYKYPSATVNGHKKLLHIYVYEKYVGPIPSDITVDHIKSNDILDVRLKNLRLANHSLQNHNRDFSKNRIDKYKGVYLDTSNYTVIISGHNYGSYKTAEKAAERANEVYSLIYGDQATLNIIDHSKETTIYNRIPEETITKEYIMSLTKVCDVKNIVIKKGLNPGKNGERLNDDKIVLSKINSNTLDKYKQIILDKLYPLTDLAI